MSDSKKEKEITDSDRFYAAKWNPFRSEQEPVTNNDNIHHAKNKVWFWCGVAAVIVGVALLLISFYGIPRDAEIFVSLFAIGFTATAFGIIAASFSAFLFIREKRYTKANESTHSPS